MAHVLRTCLFALHLGRALRLSESELTNTYYTTLLRFVGCTADSHELLDFAGGDDVRFRQLMVTISSNTPDEMAPELVRFLEEAGVRGDLPMRVQNAIEAPDGIGSRIAAAHCEVATLLASRLGFDSTVCTALRRAFERWDGLGHPHGYAGDAVPIAIRLAVVARDIEVLTRAGKITDARSVLRLRRGHAYDPQIVDAFLENEEEILRAAESKDPWHDVLRCEPGEPRWVSPDEIDATLTAFADFADAKTPFFVGHSRGVARLAETAITALGAAPTDAERVRRAALVQDIGRTGIPNAIWERQGQLSIEEWERVRLHPYYTERILTRSEGLRSVCTLASAHHERLDGSGYHRGSQGAELDMAARVVAAADACHAMMHPRPHRAALCLEDVARELRADAARGKLDVRAVEAVLGAATGATPRAAKPSNPARLTDREIAVLRLMAQGHPNREMAAALGITAKTVGHHVQHIYDKIGVSTRAAAAIFAVEHQLL